MFDFARKKITRIMLIVLLLTLVACTHYGTPYTENIWQLIEISNQRIKSGRYVGARNILRKALPIAKKKKDTVALARINNDYCLSYVLEKEHLLKAEDYCKKAKKIADKENYPLELAHNERNMAQLWNILNNPYAVCYHIKMAKQQLKKLRQNQNNPPYGAGLKEIEYLDIQVSNIANKISCAEIVN